MKTKYDNVWVNPTPEEVRGVGTVPIAFDLDSVLNTGDYLINYVAKAFGHHAGEDIRGKHPEHGYEVFNYEVPGVSIKEMYKAVHQGVMEESPSCLPSPCMSAVLDWVYYVTGKPVMVITSRHPMNTDVTYNWLNENVSAPFNCFIMNGVVKNVPLSLLGASIFVDDRHKTIRNLINTIPYPVLFKQMWNQGRPEELPVLAIDDLRGIIPLLNIQLGRNPMDWPYWVAYPKPTGERITKKYATIM